MRSVRFVKMVPTKTDIFVRFMTIRDKQILGRIVEIQKENKGYSGILQR